MLRVGMKLSLRGTYTARDNALREKSGLATETNSYLAAHAEMFYNNLCIIRELNLTSTIHKHV